MDKVNLRGKLFDAILETAVRDDFEQELEKIPSEEDLSKEYSISAGLQGEIKKIIEDGHRKIWLQKVRRISKKAAVVIAVIIPITLAGLFSVEASRTAIFNAILDWQSDHATIHFEESSSSQAPQSMLTDGFYKPVYLPDGFVEGKITKIGASARITYQNKDKTTIRFNQSPVSKEGSISVDTEHTVYSEITINGYKASLFAGKTSKDDTILVWRNKTNSFTLISPISKDELLKIAENIKISEN
ncbi:MAG: hypothetical protein K0Q85_722 [Caproiciproducens sp.]|nr:hypothetical protein [Caproiciproducens sp.]